MSGRPELENWLGIDWQAIGLTTGQIAELLLIPTMLVMGLQNIVYFAQIIATLRERIAHPLRVGTERDLWSLSDRQALAVSIIAPAYNEELTITESLRSLLSVNYPDFEVIVVNDGSKDRTVEVLIEAFDLVPRSREKLAHIHHQPVKKIYGSPTHPNLIVIDKENGRKADAANTGICFARNPLICVIDADSLIDTDAMLRVTQPFLSDDGNVIAAGGNIRLTNGCTIKGGRLVEVGFPANWWARFQVLEYLRAFMVSRVSFARWSMLMLISGAFGVFRRDAVVRVGGFEHGTVGEDLELVVRLHRDAHERGQPGRIVHVPDAICWTEAPFNYGGLSNQRARWTQGGIEVLVKHREMMFNSSYGRAGAIGLPLVLLETVCAPLFELFSYFLLPVLFITDTQGFTFVAVMIAMSLVMGTCVSLLAIGFEELQQRRHEKFGHVLALIACAFLENFGYRQLNFWFRLRGMLMWKNKNQAWATVQRKGFAGGKG